MKFEFLRPMIISFCASASLGAGSADAQSPPPCSLLTTAEVSAVVGATAGAGQPIGTTGCSWSAPHVITTVSLWDLTSWEKLKVPMPGMSKSSVAGLGDDAILSTVGPSGKEMSSLAIKKGNKAYVVKVYGVAPTDQLSMEKALAAKVLANL